MVAEYTTDELAEGSDDEKRLEKAERAAEVKAAKRRKKRGGGVAVLGRPRGQPRPPAPLAVAAQAAALQFQPTTTARRPGAAMASGQRAVGPCFACGEMGHLRLHCPKITAAADSGRRWYPFHTSDSSDNVCGVAGNRPDKKCDVVCVGDMWGMQLVWLPQGSWLWTRHLALRWPGNGR